ncbi:Putative transcription elongation factor TFIIS [Invertebrate iridescent virus 30]|uniref:Putative transcription elongation factor TFIIS n=1 Tax=Invertebrate iridescent virus 30 TaxID=345585 RepID=W8W1R9_9VIRU|nr:Putative transcription elongation factor TFIIS [Invertebrate iridescent virus 30]CCV02278.1 Putative transcription elongation factor TFIIS [Invertebrate iridescent virus 30]
MELEVMAKHLEKYFSKQKNIDYIIKKIKGPNQTLKLYEILCMLNNPNANENKLEQIIQYIKNDTLLWSNPAFDKERKKVEEENDFNVCPYEISEGVLQCKKCGCKKIFSFTKQTRSIDEPTTVFAMCSNKECNNKWCEGS